MRHACLTLLCATLFLASMEAQTESERKASVAYLQDCQQSDGGFVPSGAAQSSLRGSTTALRALKYFGGEPRDGAACARFVQRCFDKNSGGFADRPGQQPDVISTAVGIMAIVELKLPVDDYREAAVSYLTKHGKAFEEIRMAAAGLEAIRARPPVADAWLEQLAQGRHGDGTYGTGDGVARATGGTVVAVLRLGGKVEHRDIVIRVLQTGQRDDGGFGKERAPTSDLETSYRVMRALHMLEAKPDVERFRKFVVRCRNADGGYGIAPGQPSSTGATYFAAIILHWLE
jgi:prenyltransferase beta subunit